MRILIVEDAPRLRATLGKMLAKSGYAVDLAEDGTVALDLAASHSYDVVVLDRMLPGGDGLGVLGELRARGNPVPVLVLTALDAIEERVRGLSQGADDYLTKPFAIEELIARVEALARRRYDQSSPRLVVGPLVIDLATKSVTLGTLSIVLKPREFSLLACLARQPGRVLSRLQLEERLYGESTQPLSNAIEASICSLRKSLGEAGTMLRTRRGLGYVLDAV